jgi:hypothetical protein
MPPDQPEDDAFGQKKGPTMAKAYVYAIPGFVREDRP